MKNGARYIVETRWGVFSLDEGAYQDYLAGKLWITWEPGKRNTNGKPAGDYMPPNISKRAVELRDQADKHDVWHTLHEMGIYEAPIPYNTRLDDISIDELNLTVRSSNGLKCANAGTFGRVKALIESENGITSVRNLGLKSAKEITDLFYDECYIRLLPYEKAIYWQELLQKTETGRKIGSSQVGSLGTDYYDADGHRIGRSSRGFWGDVETEFDD